MLPFNITINVVESPASDHRLATSMNEAKNAIVDNSSQDEFIQNMDIFIEEMSGLGDFFGKNHVHRMRRELDENINNLIRSDLQIHYKVIINGMMELVHLMAEINDLEYQPIVEAINVELDTIVNRNSDEDLTEEKVWSLIEPALTKYDLQPETVSKYRELLSLVFSVRNALPWR